MPTYTLPNFNIPMGIFGPGGSTPPGFPYVTTGQLYLYSRIPMTQTTPPGGLAQCLIGIRLPIGILTSFPTPGKMVGCLIQVFPVGCPYTAYYVITAWEVMHRGFPNQYVMATVHQSDSAGGPVDPNRDF